MSAVGPLPRLEAARIGGAEVGQAVAPGARAVLTLERAGRHVSPALPPPATTSSKPARLIRRAARGYAGISIWTLTAPGGRRRANSKASTLSSNE